MRRTGRTGPERGLLLASGGRGDPLRGHAGPRRALEEGAVGIERAGHRERRGNVREAWCPEGRLHLHQLPVGKELRQAGDGGRPGPSRRRSTGGRNRRRKTYCNPVALSIRSSCAAPPSSTRGASACSGYCSSSSARAGRSGSWVTERTGTSSSMRPTSPTPACAPWSTRAPACSTSAPPACRPCGRPTSTSSPAPEPARGWRGSPRRRPSCS